MIELLSYKTLLKAYQEIPYKMVSDLLKGVKTEELEESEEPSFFVMDGKKVVCTVQTTET